MIIVAAVIVVGTLVLMTSGVVSPIIALTSGVILAALLRIITPAQAFSGLSNAGIITVGAMLVIAKGIVQTGIVSRATRRLLLTVTSARQALRRLAVPVGVASGLMNTTPIVAMLIPASKQLEQTRNIPAREVMLPIAHLTTLAGSITLIGTSSNLLIAGIAGTKGVDMSLLSFAPVALPVAVVGALVLYFTAPRILRGQGTTEESVLDWRVELPLSGRAISIGRMPHKLGLKKTRDYELESIKRDGEYLAPDAELRAGDLLVFYATEAGIKSLWVNPLFGLEPHRLYSVSVNTGEHGTLNDFEDLGAIRVIAAQTTVSLRRTPLTAGATCYVTAEDVQAIQDSEFVALWQDAASRAPQPGKTWLALAILVAVIGAASLGLAPVELTSVAGALLMVLTGVLTPRSAARALDWNVLFILAGSVSLGAVVIESGLADQLAKLIRFIAAGNELGIVLVLAVVTALLTNLVTNAAAASILTPVAIVLAIEIGLDPVTMLALIGTCISFTFVNPFSHQTNLMVIGPIGYSKAQFVRFGAPLLVVCLAAACGMALVLA